MREVCRPGFDQGPATPCVGLAGSLPHMHHPKVLITPMRESCGHHQAAAEGATGPRKRSGIKDRARGGTSGKPAPIAPYRRRKAGTQRHPNLSGSVTEGGQPAGQKPAPRWISPAPLPWPTISTTVRPACAWASAPVGACRRAGHGNHCRRRHLSWHNHLGWIRAKLGCPDSDGLRSPRSRNPGHPPGLADPGPASPGKSGVDALRSPPFCTIED